MPALQIVSLDTATPQLRAPASGDTYAAPRAMEITPVALTGSTATSSLAITQTWNTTGTPSALDLNVTDTASNAASLLMNLRVGGTSRLSVDKTGAVVISDGTSALTIDSTNGATTFSQTPQMIFQTSNALLMRHGNSDALGIRAVSGAVDPKLDFLNTSNALQVRLTTDAANTLAQRNGVNAQAFNIYNTFTDASNYERGFVKWSGNVLQIGHEAAGTGATRTLFIGSNAKGITVNPINNTISFISDGGSGPVVGATGIGFSGWAGGAAYTLFGSTQSGITNRAGSTVNLYPLGGSGSATAGQVGLFASLNGVSGTAGHTFELAIRTFLPATGTPGIQFGGTTSSFPALRRSTTSLQARLADDSAFTNIQGKLTTETAYTAGSIVPTGFLTLYDSTGTAYRVPCVV